MPDVAIALENGGWDQRLIVCRCGTLVDVFVVVTERFVIVVDTLFSGKTAAALLEIARRHATGKRRLLALNTHADWDHAWGNGVFSGAGAVEPVPLLGTRRCAERLRSPEGRAELAEMRAAQPERFSGASLVPPSIVFDERLSIDGGDLTLDLFATPGHQPDHCSIYIPQIGALLAGDAAEYPFPFVQSAESLPELRASLARMAALEPRTALYCHAPVDAGPALLQQNIAYFDELEVRCRAALAAGAPARPDEDADVEALIGWRFAEALPPGANAAELESFYRPAHQSAIRATLGWAGRA